MYQIADILSEEKVLCPSAYLAAKGVGNRRNSKFEDPYRWWGTTVSYILARVEYMGHTVNFKTFKICYRDKHRKQAPKAVSYTHLARVIRVSFLLRFRL